MGFRMYTVYSNKKDWEQREREVEMDMLPAAAVVPLYGHANYAHKVRSPWMICRYMHGCKYYLQGYGCVYLINR